MKLGVMMEKMGKDYEEKLVDRSWEMGGGLRPRTEAGGSEDGGIVEEGKVGFGVRESKGSGVLGQHGRDAHAPFLGAVAPVEFWRFLVLQGRFV